MKISAPELLRRNGEAVYRVGVETSRGPDALWYTVPEEYAGFLTDSCDAALVALLIPAMACGEDIHIAGTVSERLWYNLSGRYQVLLQHMMPALRRIRISAGELCVGEQRAPGVALGFSAGIDSFSVLADHLGPDVPRGLRVTHLLSNNVGSHLYGGERLFNARYAGVRSVAARMGLPLIKVNSNLDEFYGDGIGFQQTNQARNVSVPLMLQGGIGRFLFASSISYPDIAVAPSPDLSDVDDIALPLLSSEVVDAITVGSEYTRVEKTLRVAEIPESYAALDVCVRAHAPGNCSVCWKCRCTLLTLEVAGLVDRYAAVFDLAAYRRRRTRYIGRVLRCRHDPDSREIVRFAEARHYAFPRAAYVYARLPYTTNVEEPLWKAPASAARLLAQRSRSPRQS